MATVRLSESLCDSIAENAQRLFTKRVSEAMEYPPENQDGDLIFDAYLDANADARRVLNDMAALNWAKRYPEMRVLLFDSATVLRFKKPRFIYIGWAESHFGERLSITCQNAPGLQFLYDKLQERKRRIADVTKERDEFVNKVKGILDNCTTLKQALSIWPGLWELVPQDAKSKHNEVTIRTKAEPVEPISVDIDALNGAVVVAKIVEGVI